MPSQTFQFTAFVVTLYLTAMFSRWYLKRVRNSSSYNNLKASTKYTDKTYPRYKLYSFLFMIWVIVCSMTMVFLAVCFAAILCLLVYLIQSNIYPASVATYSLGPRILLFYFMIPMIVPAGMLAYYGIPRTPGLDRFMRYFYISQSGMDLMKEDKGATKDATRVFLITLLISLPIVVASIYSTSYITDEKVRLAYNSESHPLLLHKQVRVENIEKVRVVITEGPKFQIYFIVYGVDYRFTPTTVGEIQSMMSVLRQKNVPIVRDDIKQYLDDVNYENNCTRSKWWAAYEINADDISCVKGSLDDKVFSGEI